MLKVDVHQIAKAVVEKLEEERKRQKLSHETLAKMTGLNRSAVSLIEAQKRNPTLLSCLKIAAALNIDLGKMVSKAQKNANLSD